MSWPPGKWSLFLALVPGARSVCRAQSTPQGWEGEGSLLSRPPSPAAPSAPLRPRSEGKPLKTTPGRGGRELLAPPSRRIHGPGSSYRPFYGVLARTEVGGRGRPGHGGVAERGVLFGLEPQAGQTRVTRVPIYVGGGGGCSCGCRGRGVRAGHCRRSQPGGPPPRPCRAPGPGTVPGAAAADGTMEAAMELGGEKTGCEARGPTLTELKANGKVLAASGGPSALGGQFPYE